MSIIINTGMWIERFVIVVQSLSRDFMPSAWGIYTPTIWDIATFVGSIGLFFALMFLFIRFLPMISISEMRGLLVQTQEQRKAQREKARTPEVQG
jgi:molybdopterin-containing oxidoreductase family membrane subunit